MVISVGILPACTMAKDQQKQWSLVRSSSYNEPAAAPATAGEVEEEATDRQTGWAVSE